jgi:uncharacterized membrane protein
VSGDAATAKTLSRVLTAGIAAGGVLLVIGAILTAVQTGLHPGIGVGEGGFALRGLLALEGPAFIRAGILVLILTPVVRVLAVAALLLQRNDRGGVLYAIVVLLLLTLATVLDLRH